MPQWNDNLDGPHLDIAQVPGSPLRVLAGPGTGKSFALMRRIGRLLQEGAVPARILVSTFTRTAATDLRDALGNLGIEGAHAVKAGTLHALSFKILSQGDVLQMTGRVPRPLMEFETRFLVQDLSLGGTSLKECRKQLQAFNAAWARLQSDDPGWLNDAADAEFDHALRAWLTFHKAMLIGELVPECRKYLRDNPLCPERSLFSHVLVDEYQDLNRAEQDLLELLAGDGTLTVIGDENQSIYSFKHAHPEGIVDFQNAHPNTTSKSLTVCRRCPKKIVRISNALLASGNPNARQLQPREANPDGEVSIVQWQSIHDEALGVATFVRNRIAAAQIAAGDVLVLAPRRQFGYAIRDALIGLDVSAHSYFSEQELDGNPTKLEDSEAQQAFTLLTLLADPADAVALRNWCGFGSSSLNAAGWSRIRKHCAEVELPVRTVLGSLANGQLKLPHSNKIIERYNKLLALEQEHANEVGEALLNNVFPTQKTWAEPLRALGASLEGDFSAADLIESVRAGVVQPELPTKTDFVRVMSLHKSKGLTAKLVVIAGVIEGLIPSKSNPKTTDQERQRKLEEDRRLFYVALTRAQQTLVISSVQRLPLADAAKMNTNFQPIGGGMVRTISSRFLSQLGPHAPQPIPGANLH